MVQVLTGSALGWLAAQTFPASTTKTKEYYGWHPNKPAKSASAIAGTTALATGVPHAASALMPLPSNPPEGNYDLVSLHHACPTSLNLLRTSGEGSFHKTSGRLHQLVEWCLSYELTMGYATQLNFICLHPPSPSPNPLCLALCVAPPLCPLPPPPPPCSQAPCPYPAPVPS